MTRTRAGTTWFGPGIWSTALPRCSLPVRVPRPCGHLSILRSASKKTVVFRRISGLMEIRTGAGIQLDEVAFPILLALRLSQQNALQEFDPYPMVLKAASYLLRHGPVTQQERWEEASGYSPSTLASNIAALIGAAYFCRQRADKAAAEFLEQYADFLESHIEAWTVTTDGTLIPGSSTPLHTDTAGGRGQP